jgi:predicted ATP-grasp superfamily ATP-dependent carboligase
MLAFSKKAGRRSRLRFALLRKSAKIFSFNHWTRSRPGGMHTVLVLDANQRSALAIIRSLGRHGLRVIAGDHVPVPLGSASRYAAALVPYPNPARAPSGFVNEITGIVQRFGVDTIVPATDLTTMVLASQSALSQSVHLACPSAASYEALTDKAALFELAGRLGVAAPESRVAWTAAQIDQAAREMGQPVVLKPARSRYLKDGTVVSTSVEIVDSPAGLPRTIERLSWLGDIPCLVQRFIPGYGAGVFALHGGPSGPIAWFAHKRIREKPPTGGVSVLSESVPLDSVMKCAAAKLLAAVGWTGVAMVEFRVGPDGTPYLMEVNGRFWGSLQLSIDCGVDFPWLLYRLIHGLPIEPPSGYAIGRRLRWVLGDLDSLIIEWRREGASSGSRRKAVSAFLRSFADPFCRQEVLRFSDPGPGVREAMLWLKALRE